EIRSRSRRAPPSARALAGDHDGRGSTDDGEIRPQRLCSRVAQVEADHLVERRAAPTGDLPQSGHAGFGIDDATAMPGPVLRVFVRHGRSWADQGHLAAQHVPELRQLVEARLSEKAAERGDALVVGELEHARRGAVGYSARGDEPAHELTM